MKTLVKENTLPKIIIQKPDTTKDIYEDVLNVLWQKTEAELKKTQKELQNAQENYYKAQEAHDACVVMMSRFSDKNHIPKSQNDYKRGKGSNRKQMVTDALKGLGGKGSVEEMIEWHIKNGFNVNNDIERRRLKRQITQKTSLMYKEGLLSVDESGKNQFKGYTYIL